MTTTEMLRKSKLDIYGLGCPHDKFIECVERFAELVRADEREACAKVCDDYDDEYDVHTRQTVEGIALQIRARSNIC